MTKLERVIKARQILSDRSRWTQGEFAKNREGRPLLPSKLDSPEAHCFCMAGALNIDFKLFGWISLPNVVSHNDHHTWEENLTYLDQQIEELRNAA